MTYKDRLANWVERHKFEEVSKDGVDRLYISYDGGKTLEGPYTEEEANDILWEKAMELDATDLYEIDV